jgi:3-oxoacyl-[acyl-carrier protein] reductase
MVGKRFLEKHVLITGGGRGIGFEIARQFGGEGAILSIFEYKGDLLDHACEELRAAGYTVNPYLVDVSKRQEVIDAVVDCEKIAPIDTLINNAGIAFETPFLNINEEEWRSIIDINLTGMFFVAQAVSRKMVSRKAGVIINMSSKNGLDGEFGYAHYNASKGGAVMLTKTMALELAHLGIRVNAVCPGYISTPMSQAIDDPAFIATFVDRLIPLNRTGRIEEIPPLFLFLASDEASFITGQTFVIDGGQLAGQKPWPALLNKIRVDA